MTQTLAPTRRVHRAWWVCRGHMAALVAAAGFAGSIRTARGDSFLAWVTAGGLCVVAAAACLMIPKRP